MNVTVFYIFINLLYFFSFINSNSLINNEHDENASQKPPTSALLSSDSLVFISTLNGTLYAVHHSTGEILWSLKEDPVLKIPMNTGRSSIFLANPKDGSMYSFKLGQDGLKKLPFTIPDLVSISPCKSSDGLLYTGYKKDSWFSVDLLTGSKVHILNMDGPQEVCPSNTASTIFIGRTEYTIVMFDGESRKISWNATFMDYSSHVAMDTNDLDIHHFASSSNGYLVTMDTLSGRIKWSHQFDSPVVGIYSLNEDHILVTRSFHTMGLETLAHLSSSNMVGGSEWADKFMRLDHFQDHFTPTLYIGKNSISVYALPSFVDEASVSISPKSFGRPLLEGPDSKMSSNQSEFMQNRVNFTANQNADDDKGGGARGGVFLIGHHEVPDLSTKSHVDRLPIKLIEHKIQQPIANKDSNELNSYSSIDKNISILFDQLNVLNKTYNDASNGYVAMTTVFNIIITTVIIIGLVNYAAYFYMNKVKKPESISDSKVFKIGKIMYNMEEILGQGCNGTFVYRGKFENRDVAVKRLLNCCIDVANREVDLLKESDYHPNVIRYFCMEQDHQFNYIALELCPFTLYDVIEEGSGESRGLDIRDVLQQMLAGIAHLHSLNIVHRDVKPHNVLLSFPATCGKVRAMISDFGLCKKLSPNKNSVSKATGATGTDGWIAPEMFLTNQKRMTQAVDVFSCGCVIYYVLSKGIHPFGDALNRQANIMKGSYSLKSLSDEDYETARHLIERMINQQPTDRPTINQILRHPFFWSKDKQLRFFEAVSDRLEKLLDDDVYVVRLECQGLKVVGFDWTKKISQEFQQDLRKFRSYKKHSVRDLLRAIRNKRHHYRELPKELQVSLGTIPDEFIDYFTCRFPLLLIHTYLAMQLISGEPSLAPFY